MINDSRWWHQRVVAEPASGIRADRLCGWRFRRDCANAQDAKEDFNPEQEVNLQRTIRERCGKANERQPDKAYSDHP